jgi:hypothetical protein
MATHALHIGMEIVVAGFLGGLNDEAEGNQPICMMSGTVSDCGFLSHIGASNIFTLPNSSGKTMSNSSSTLSNVSGGAVFCVNHAGCYLTGIHLGVYLHDDVTVKAQETTQDNRSAMIATDVLFKDGSKCCFPTEKQHEIALNTEGNHKRSTAYFVTMAAIVDILAPNMSKKADAAVMKSLQYRKCGKRGRFSRDK